MARTYVRRSDRKSVMFSIPITEEMREKLWIIAVAVGRKPTEIAREAIEKKIAEASAS